jgi:hypothetical protein
MFFAGQHLYLTLGTTVNGHSKADEVLEFVLYFWKGILYQKNILEYYCKTGAITANHCQNKSVLGCVFPSTGPEHKRRKEGAAVASLPTVPTVVLYDNRSSTAVVVTLPPLWLENDRNKTNLPRTSMSERLTE